MHPSIVRVATAAILTLDLSTRIFEVVFLNLPLLPDARLLLSVTQNLKLCDCDNAVTLCGEGTNWSGRSAIAGFRGIWAKKGDLKAKIVVLGNNGFWRVCPAF